MDALERFGKFFPIASHRRHSKFPCLASTSAVWLKYFLDCAQDSPVPACSKSALLERGAGGGGVTPV